MNFSNLKSWMPAAGFDNDEAFYRDVHFKTGQIEYFDSQEDGKYSRLVCKANGRVVGVVSCRTFHTNLKDTLKGNKPLFIGVFYTYAIPVSNGNEYVQAPGETYLGFFENKGEAWIAVCDAATEMEREVRADMKAGRANKYFSTEHLNASYYPFSGEPKNPDDNGGFYDPSTPLFNDQELPAVA